MDSLDAVYSIFSNKSVQSVGFAEDLTNSPSKSGLSQREKAERQKGKKRAASPALQQSSAVNIIFGHNKAVFIAVPYKLEAPVRKQRKTMTELEGETTDCELEEESVAKLDKEKFTYTDEELVISQLYDFGILY